jgi:hypothetical protein
MSSKENHMISISNYEEWFILYMDDELTAEQKTEVDNFLLSHPHLQEEMDVLLSTKLPAGDIRFSGKDSLRASAMKLNLVDESLLLYIDNELTPAEKKAVEEKLQSDNDFRLQLDALKHTRLDAAEIVPYPNKEELYRRTNRVVPLFPVWMRAAVAVVLLLAGSYVFLFNDDNIAAIEPGAGYASVKPQKKTETTTQVQPESKKADAPLPQPDAVALHTTVNGSKTTKKEAAVTGTTPANKILPQQESATEPVNNAVAILEKADAVQVDKQQLNTQISSALNNSLANRAVTSVTAPAYNLSDNPEEAIVIDGEENKKTPAKGFLRKVSRFIERRTGIGTVNADNEILVGAVALKLN